MLSGLACLPIIVLSSLIPSPFCSLSPLYLFFLGTFGILSLQVMTIYVARVTSHQPCGLLTSSFHLAVKSLAAFSLSF